MEKDYVFAVPTDSNFRKISQEVHIPDYFLKISLKRRSNYNDKEFYYIGQSLSMMIKIILPSLLPKIIMWSTILVFEKNTDYLYCSFAVLQYDLFFLSVENII
jgi:hypothetical protein